MERIDLYINTRRVELANKERVCEVLCISHDTLSDWVDKGFIPAPFDPVGVSRPRTQKKGRKHLLWDLTEVMEWYMKSRLGTPHPVVSR